MFFINFIMYTVQYWNERAAEWRGTGNRNADPDIARNSLMRMQRMTEGNVRFRVIHTP